MRTIKYRGKDSFYEWVYGSLVSDEVENDNGKFMVTFIVPSIPCASNGRDMWTTKMKRVKPETIGQFTGLFDKNGKEIYEGDIVKIKSQICGDLFYEVVYSINEAAFALKNDDSAVYRYFEEIAEGRMTEVIGNIHDNPELIKD